MTSTTLICARSGSRAATGVESHVYQAVCSPFRNPLGAKERRQASIAWSRPVWALTRALARAAGAADPEIQWRFLDGPYFNNQVASITLDGRSSRLKLEKTDRGRPRREPARDHVRAGAGGPAQAQPDRRSEPVAALRSAEEPP